MLDREGDIELRISPARHCFTLTAIQTPGDNSEFYVNFIEVMEELGMLKPLHRPLEYTMVLDSAENLYHTIQKLKSAFYNISYADELETKSFLQIGISGTPRKYLTKQMRDQAFRNREKYRKKEQRSRIIELETEVIFLKQQCKNLQLTIVELKQANKNLEFQNQQLEMTNLKLRSKKINQLEKLVRSQNED